VGSGGGRRGSTAKGAKRGGIEIGNWKLEIGYWGRGRRRGLNPKSEDDQAILAGKPLKH